MKKLEIVYQKTQWFNEELYEFLRLQKRYESHEEMLRVLASKLENVCFRLYVCDDRGYQTSPNILHKDGKWLSQQQYVNSNWSWRPYFLENIIKMRNEKKGILSDLYTDIETSETIRTFSYPVNNKEYIFYSTYPIAICMKMMVCCRGDKLWWVSLDYTIKEAGKNTLRFIPASFAFSSLNVVLF